MSYRFEARLWEWPSRANWFFVSLPFGIADEIEAKARGYERGFGSVRVRARVGATIWRTSVFPESDTYVLPIKKQVRDAEDIARDATVAVELDLVDLA